MAIIGLTPNGQITIPRSIMKMLDLQAGSNIAIEIVNNSVIIKKIEDTPMKSGESHSVFKAV